MNWLNKINNDCFTIMKSKNGQMMVEYALILLLIVLVVIVMVKGIGDTNYNTYSKINSGVNSAMQH